MKNVSISNSISQTNLFKSFYLSLSLSLNKRTKFNEYFCLHKMQRILCHSLTMCGMHVSALASNIISIIWHKLIYKNKKQITYKGIFKT